MPSADGSCAISRRRRLAMPWCLAITSGSDALILPAVLAKIVGYDCKLGNLARRLKCRQCGEKRVRVRAVEPGER